MCMSAVAIHEVYPAWVTTCINKKYELRVLLQIFFAMILPNIFKIGQQHVKGAQK